LSTVQSVFLTKKIKVHVKKNTSTYFKLLLYFVWFWGDILSTLKLGDDLRGKNERNY